MSPKAAAGILRRAKKRDRDLPPQLERVLRALAAKATPAGSAGENSPAPSGASEEARTTGPTREPSSPPAPELLQMEMF